VEQTTRSIDHSISKRQASLEASSGRCGAVQWASLPRSNSNRRQSAADALPRLCEARRRSRRCGRGKGATEQVLLMQEQMTWAKYWQASLMSYWSGGPCKLGALFNRTGCTPMGTGLPEGRKSTGRLQRRDVQKLLLTESLCITFHIYCIIFEAIDQRIIFTILIGQHQHTAP